MISAMDVRILRQQCFQAGQSDSFGRAFTGVDANGARRLLAKFAKRGQFTFDLIKPRAYGHEQSLSGFGRRDATGGARQQPKTADEPQAPGWYG